MRYNFDEIIHREGTACVKYDLRKKYFRSENIIPLWVADMDFASPEFIRQAIIHRAEHPIYGYTMMQDGFYNSIISWMQKRHAWNIKKEWISFSPGIVPALHLSVMAYTSPGDKVIIQPPVYFRFSPAVEINNRTLVNNQLYYKNGSYQMDLDDLEKRIDKRTRLLLLCHPHNPTGNVWEKEILERLVDICIKNSITILSDEIHSDLIFRGHRHIPLASISDAAAKITVTCVSPSKTFNLAGLASAAIIIRDPVLRKLMNNVMDQVHISNVNIFGLIALQAAYEKGDDWLEQLLNYLEGNLELLKDYFQHKIPDVKVIIPEATYMVWLDFRNLLLSDKQLNDFIIKAGLGLNDGPSFGPGGTGFQRLNFAVPRPILLKALQQLEMAINSLGK